MKVLKLFWEVIKMNTNIYLVRHAHSIYTPDELNRPLSEKGYRDSERVRAILLTESIDVVLASPFKRAIQTVEGVAKDINVEILAEEGFKERKVAEDSVDNFDSAMTKLWTNFEFAFKHGESNLEAQKRGINALNKVLDKYNGKNIVIGTHGNIMVLIMNYFDNKYNFDLWKNLSMPDIYKLSFREKKFIGSERIWK